jgi:two-component system, NtrC family, response regulator HydG
MPLSAQAKLLRVVQDRMVTPLGSTQSIECDVRWVAATNVSLESMVEVGKFREDLLYRLRVVTIEIPPLRARVEDIDILTDHFMKEFSEREMKQPLGISAQVRELLSNYSWPGNVRELKNVVERAVVLASGSEWNVDLLPMHIAQVQTAKEIRVAVGTSLQSVEDKLIEETLRSCGGDKTQAAAILGVAPRTIYRWIERREIERGGADRSEVE